MFAVEAEVGDLPSFELYRQQMDTAMRMYDYCLSNEHFKYGFTDGWYGHSTRGLYLKYPAYKEGLDAGKRDSKEQRMVNLLRKSNG